MQSDYNPFVGIFPNVGAVSIGDNNKVAAKSKVETWCESPTQDILNDA
jgi:hypothetical protein